MYSLEIDQELKVGDKVYYIQVSAKLEYSYEEDPECTGVEVTRAEIAPLEGDPLPIGYEGIAIEKIIVEGHPELTEAIDNLLWDKIQTNTEDNYRDLGRDLCEAKYERDL